VTAWLVPSRSATTVVAVAIWLMSAPLLVSWTPSPLAVSEGRPRAVQMTYSLSSASRTIVFVLLYVSEL
jgi:hypothetical protein